jgi:hypothetical protein
MADRYRAPGGVSRQVLSDLAIRTELKRSLRAQADPAALVVDEFGLLHGQARADVALIGDWLQAYEIKSGLDNLERLARQVGYYSRIFDEVTLVADARHSERAIGVIPEWWGLVEARESPDGEVLLSCKRRACRNEATEASALVRLLWRCEAATILAQRDALSGIERRPKWVLYEAILAIVPVVEIRPCVTVALRARQEWRKPSPSMPGDDSSHRAAMS